MPYDRSRQRWIVVRLLPNFRHVDVARFQKFSDADGYVRILRRIDPGVRYEVMFDAEVDTAEEERSPEDP